MSLSLCGPHACAHFLSPHASSQMGVQTSPLGGEASLGPRWKGPRRECPQPLTPGEMRPCMAARRPEQNAELSPGPQSAVSGQRWERKLLSLLALVVWSWQGRGSGPPGEALPTGTD